MKTGASDIRKINEANLVMRHFVQLSAHLLPYLERITRKKRLSKREKADKQFVLEVYDQYQVDVETSKALINSNILELIVKSFQTLKHRNRENEDEVKRSLNNFLLEYHRLVENWKQIELN
jgi:hypothetical protein